MEGGGGGGRLDGVGAEGLGARVAGDLSRLVVELVGQARRVDAEDGRARRVDEELAGASTLAVSTCNKCRYSAWIEGG